MSLARVVPPLSHAPLKPYPLRKARRAVAMTIAVGLVFKDGILLAADTEITDGDLKYTQSKIVSHTQPGVSVAFAFAGDVAEARMAIDEIIASLGESGVTTHRGVLGVVKAELSDIYARIILPRTMATQENPRSFYLLIAVWAEGTCRLWSSTGAAVNAVGGYECFGIGATLARYLIKPLHRPECSEHDAKMIAVRALVDTKDNVPGCGGASEFLIARSTGELTPPQALPLVAQHNLISAFNGLMPLVFFCAGDLDGPDEEVRATASLLVESLLAERAKAKAAHSKTCSDFSDLFDGD